MVDYSGADKILHRLALHWPAVSQMMFDIDQAISKPDPDSIRDGHHVFVSGLARAGTTILMRRIYASEAFTSLTYRNMPFVMAPGLWTRLSARSARAQVAAERAHGDGILVSVDSPESLDEVFWRIQDGGAYIGPEALTPHAPAADVCADFAAYVAGVLKADTHHRGRYLSKNNNNILRLPALRRLFPNASLLIPFRHPVSHAASLLRQHRNFSEQQTSEPFTRAYMTWLGHHEFGLDHRPFRFDAEGAGELGQYDDTTLSYWAEIWRQTYDWLARTAPADALFVCYEDLCETPAVWAALARQLGLPEGEETREAFVAPAPPPEAALAPDLLDTCEALYADLRKRGAARLGTG